MNDAIRSRKRADGFSLVELVVVIVIVGVLAAIAGPRFAGNQAFAQRGYYEELVSAFRFAQKQAVASGCPVRVTLTAAGYSAYQQQPTAGRCDVNDVSFPLPVRLSDGEPLSGTAPAGAGTAALTVTYSPLGQTDLGADATVSVGPLGFTIHSASGYVETP